MGVNLKNGEIMDILKEKAVNHAVASAVFHFLMLDHSNKYSKEIDIVALNQIVRRSVIMDEESKGKKKKVLLRFRGIDYFNRPIFKEIGKNVFYGCTDKLYPWDVSTVDIDVKVSDLTFFGNSFDCEPMGTPCPENEEWLIIQE